MAEYTPTTDFVLEGYRWWRREVQYEVALAEFERWLAAHDESVRAAERERITAALRHKFGPTNRAADWIDRTFWEPPQVGAREGAGA